MCVGRKEEHGGVGVGGSIPSSFFLGCLFVCACVCVFVCLFVRSFVLVLSHPLLLLLLLLPIPSDDDENIRGQPRSDPGQEREAVKAFLQMWQPFDWTAELDGGEWLG